MVDVIQQLNGERGIAFVFVNGITVILFWKEDLLTYKNQQKYAT